MKSYKRIVSNILFQDVSTGHQIPNEVQVSDRSRNSKVGELQIPTGTWPLSRFPENILKLLRDSPGPNASKFCPYGPMFDGGMTLHKVRP